MKLIALTGRAGCGKNTCANTIHSPSRFEYSFATPLKMACLNIFGGTLEGWFGESSQREKEIPGWGTLTYRKALQIVGTDLFRDKFDKDIWVKSIANRIKFDAGEKRNAIDQGCTSYFIITDLRFDNEVDMVRKMGGTVVHITRGPAPKTVSHISEAGVIPELSDCVFHNDGSLCDLQERFPLLVKEIPECSINTLLNY